MFETLRALPQPVFLDSGRPRSPWGRFDLLTADPICRLRCEDGQNWHIDPSGLRRQLPGTPFAALQALLDTHCPATVHSDREIPFAGGALGYFSYDLGRYLENLPSQAVDDLALPALEVGIYSWAIVVDHQLQRSQMVSHYLTQDQLQRISDRLTPPDRPIIDTGFQLQAPFRANMDAQGYRARFDKVQHYIHSGDCYQVNLAQRFSAPYKGDPWQAYRYLREQAPTPFSAYLEGIDGSILSLSPERFIEVVEGRVETRPIKGTRPRASDKAADQALREELAASSKDRAENLMIVDLLRNDLGRTCATGSVRVPELFKVESYANVHHLVSTISGQLADPRAVLSLLEGCFPGGSITGAPKIRAMEIIDELEPHRRGPYCGSIGYIDFNGRMDTSICIRTLVARASQLHCWAGGGIVADSTCEAEYQETFDKISNLLGPLEKQFS